MKSYPEPERMLTVLLLTGLLTVVLLLITSPDSQALGLTPTTTPVLTECQPRTDWIVYALHEGESIEEIARRIGVSLEILLKANCWNTSQVDEEVSLLVPAFPAS